MKGAPGKFAEYQGQRMELVVVSIPDYEHYQNIYYHSIYYKFVKKSDWLQEAHMQHTLT